ncbi:MAG: hypothetical protein ACRC8Y_14545 [Chroococcales cyanobacterium]
MNLISIRRRQALSRPTRAKLIVAAGNFLGRVAVDRVNWGILAHDAIASESGALPRDERCINRRNAD